MTAISDYIANDRANIFAQLKELVSFNSVHNEPGLEEEAQKAAQWVEKTLTDAGVKVEAVKTADGSTALVGKRAGKAGAKTVLLYSHYDVVPVGPREPWESDPLTLTERTAPSGDTRWYGRLQGQHRHAPGRPARYRCKRWHRPQPDLPHRGF
ncbi:hypothetical protein JCM12107_01070 [Corynebacterium simulans]